MTNTNDPLPAIQVDELGIGAALPVLMDTDDDAGEDECYTMTLAHLVAVLKLLTPEQFAAVVEPAIQQPLEFESKEKARADRAEQELSEIRAKAETVVHTDDACGLVYFINRDNPQAFWRRKNA